MEAVVRIPREAGTGKFTFVFGRLLEILMTGSQNVPFPHVNDKEANAQSFVELGQMTIRHIFRNALAATALIGAPIAALYWYRRLR